MDHLNQQFFKGWREKAWNLGDFFVMVPPKDVWLVLEQEVIERVFQGSFVESQIA